MVSRGKIKVDVRKGGHVDEGNMRRPMIKKYDKCKERSHKSEGACTVRDDSKELSKHRT